MADKTRKLRPRTLFSVSPAKRWEAGSKRDLLKTWTCVPRGASSVRSTPSKPKHRPSSQVAVRVLLAHPPAAVGPVPITSLLLQDITLLLAVQVCSTCFLL
ncbi:hypothetical protein VULLAG_LOCUS2017 [Vulpes lagopus]